MRLNCGVNHYNDFITYNGFKIDIHSAQIFPNINNSPIIIPVNTMYYARIIDNLQFPIYDVIHTQIVLRTGLPSRIAVTTTDYYVLVEDMYPKDAQKLLRTIYSNLYFVVYMPRY